MIMSRSVRAVLLASFLVFSSVGVVHAVEGDDMEAVPAVEESMAEAPAQEPAKGSMAPLAGQYPLCATCTNSGSAEKGTVPVVGGYVDIYARQYEYRQSAKEFRSSLVARQEAYEKPRRESLELYRQHMEATYTEESEAYQRELALEAENSAKEAEEGKAMASEEEIPAPEMTEAEGDEKTASAKEGQSEEEKPTGLKEKVLEPSEDEEGPVKKKVIMPEDAPEFDQSPF